MRLCPREGGRGWERGRGSHWQSGSEMVSGSLPLRMTLSQRERVRREGTRQLWMDLERVCH